MFLIESYNEFQALSDYFIKGVEGKNKNGCLLDNYTYLINGRQGTNKSSEFIKPVLPV